MWYIRSADSFTRKLKYVVNISNLHVSHLIISTLLKDSAHHVHHDSILPTGYTNQTLPKVTSYKNK